MADFSSYTGTHCVIGGAGISGIAAAHALLDAGAQVTVVDQRESVALRQLADAGAQIAIVSNQAQADLTKLLVGAKALIVSPGWRPDHQLVLAAAQVGVEVYSEPELAWRLRGPGAASWLAVTGTNGKTTTVTMLAAILAAAGNRTVACGNFGYPVLNAVLDPNPYDVLAVELSSFQLHWSTQLAPQIGVLINLADDHLDWHGGFPSYQQTKTRIWRSGVTAQGISIGNADDELVTAELSKSFGRRVSFTLGEPAEGQLGVIGGLADGVLVDRAFSIDDGSDSQGTELIALSKIRPIGAHNVANALAAAATARAYGVPASAIAAGLAGYSPEPHRNQYVATVDGVRFVDDSKATNPHATQASVAAYERVVWLAGGQLKGVDPDELVRQIVPRLAGAVLFGVDRGQILGALARHAPTLPVVEIASVDDEAMTQIVSAAAKLASPGDVVLLAPAAASFDMFSSYSARGQAFVAAVAALG